MLIARLFGFPPATDKIPVSVTLSPQENGELWMRKFGNSTFSSVQSKGTGRNTHLIVERFGPISVALAIVVKGDRLFLIPRRWSFLGLPLPKTLMPSGQSFEHEQDGQFCFDVTIAAPMLGTIVAYKGTLTPVQA